MIRTLGLPLMLGLSFVVIGLRLATTVHDAVDLPGLLGTVLHRLG